jgi:hypothetical protein
MPNWKKVIVSGSDATLSSVTATAGFTGSLQGTASYATQALSASYAITASYALNTLSASYAATASYAINLIVSGSISNADYIDFNTGSAIPAWKSGRIFWDNTEGALSVYNAEADITLQVGQENWVRVFNQTGVTITDGTPVRITGVHGDLPEIVLAQAVQVSGSALGDNQIIGLATHDIETNSIGYVTTQGLVRGLNTNAFTDGDLLFVSSSAGLMTNVIPTSPYEVIQVGICVKAGPGGSGIIFVFPTQPIDFGDLASAERGEYQYGDLWSYQLSGSIGVWKHGRQLSGSYGITGSINATSFTGSLQGTASYATQALSASYAPSTPTFPYTGSAIITGSLEVTGSVFVQDINGKTNIDSFDRKLYGTSPPFPPSAPSVLSIDWANRQLIDASSVVSVDWENRVTYDYLGNTSFDWNSRDLLDSSNTVAANWDAFTLNYKIETYTYLKKFIDTSTQDSFSDVGVVGFNYEGEVIGAAVDGTVNQFDLVYLETDGKWYPVTQGTADCSKLLGICAATGAKAQIILEGSITINDGTYTDTPLVQSPSHGLPIYIRDGAGNTMSTVVPTTLGEYVRILGHVYHQQTGTPEYWVMKFRPSNEWIVI